MTSSITGGAWVRNNKHTQKALTWQSEMKELVKKLCEG